MISFAIATLGCKVNAYESQGYILSLEKLGYVQVDFSEVADIYIINTCAVTNTAGAKSRKKIHQAIALNPSALIVAVGCYVQVESESLRAENIDLLIGSSQKNQLALRIKNALAAHTKATYISEMKDICDFDYVPIDRFKNQTRAYLKIQDGCTQFCAYCIIPFARGKERSLESDKVVEAAQMLAKQHPEIVLTGIHTGRYGKELGTSLTALIKRLLLEVSDLKRIRISSIEMNEIDIELLELMRDEERIANHLHIPIQSGCNTILELMNRPYTVEEFEEKIKLIRSYVPNIAISSDVIVGFPQESDANFLETYEMLKRNQLCFLHVFPFSKRKNTVAASMPNHIDNQCKKARVKSLMELSARMQEMYMKTFVGKKVNVIWEKIEKSAIIGHSSEYMVIKTQADEQFLHQQSSVKISGITMPYGIAIDK